MKAKKSKNNETKKNALIDKKLFSYIQPQGGITFKEPSYVLTGDGYVRCIHVYGLPNRLNDYWLQKIFGIKDTVCTIDVNTKDIATVKRNINKSIAEEASRYGTAKNYRDRYDAAKRSGELQQLYDSLDRMGEVIKVLDFRIFVKDRTLKGLEDKTEEIINNLEGDSYRATTLLNEQKSEWQSLLSSFSRSHQVPFAMKGLSLTSEQLAIGYPFNYSELQDEQGTVLGFSRTGGVVIYDEFTKTKARKYYNSIVCGDMGSGKSVFLKKRFKHHASIENFVRCFDESGEFRALTLEFGGKIIKCNGSDGRLNPLEILQSGDDDETSYAQHIKKLRSFYKCIVPEMTDYDLQTLENQLRGLYELCELVPGRGKSITGLPSDSYPILTNFKLYLEKQLEIIMERDKQAITDVETSLNVENAKRLDNILATTNNLINNYGHMFNGHTSISDITNEKIVTFDISEIKQLGNVFSAQMEMLVSLCWDNAIKNGKTQKEKWETQNYNSEEITKFLMIIDESHKWVNASMPHILNMIIEYLREARKYFAGIILASQSVRDYFPEGTDGASDKVKLLFELSQYAFMFRQSSAALPHIRNVFGNSLTYSQIESIPNLKVGQTILAIQGDRSIMFKVWLSTEYEEQLFSGGR